MHLRRHQTATTRTIRRRRLRALERPLVTTVRGCRPAFDVARTVWAPPHRSIAPSVELDLVRTKPGTKGSVVAQTVASELRRSAARCPITAAATLKTVKKMDLLTAAIITLPRDSTSVARLGVRLIEQGRHGLSPVHEHSERRGQESSAPLDGDDTPEEETDRELESLDSAAASEYEDSDSDADASTSANGASGDESQSDSSNGTIVPLSPSLMSFRAKGDAQTHLLVELNDVLGRFLRLCLASGESRRLESLRMREIAQAWDMLVEVFNRVYPALHGECVSLSAQTKLTG